MSRNLSLQTPRNWNQIWIILKCLVSHTIAPLSVPSHHVPLCFIKRGLWITVPGTSLKLEHPLQGSSCLSPAGNLQFRTQIFLLIFVISACWSLLISQPLQRLNLREQWHCLDRNPSVFAEQLWRSSFIKVSMLVHGSWFMNYNRKELDLQVTTNYLLCPDSFATMKAWVKENFELWPDIPSFVVSSYICCSFLLVLLRSL